MKFRPLALVIFLTPAVLSAQNRTAHAGTSDSLILFEHFTPGGSEFGRIALEKGQVYRAEVSSPFAVITVRGLLPGVQRPRLVRVESVPRASGTSVFEIHPFADAEYEVRVFSRGRSGASVRVYRDGDASARRQRVIGSQT